VRAVCEMAGIKNILTKAYGSTNPMNLIKASFHALSQIRTPEEVATLRGVEF
jgi:small subunit ribosomal protein S5